jgi:phosphodiesterase/alkaline phosphatase D-like protein
MTVSRRTLVIGAAAAAGLLVVLANAQLVQLAVGSQPDCVAHVKPGTVDGHDTYSAAESSC